MWQYKSPEELYHYGVLGMKWGRRKSRRKNTMSDDARLVKSIKKKRISEMSNEELKKVTSRDDLERRYKSTNQSAIKQGLAIAGTIAGAMGTMVALHNNGKDIIRIGKTIMATMNTK